MNRISVLGFCVLACIVGLTGCSSSISITASSNPKPDMLVDQSKWRWISLDEATAQSLTEPTKLEFLIPTDCVVSNNDDSSEGVLLGRRKDIAGILADKNLSVKGIKRGVFCIFASTDVAYFPEEKKFSGEDQMEKAFKNAGIIDFKKIRKTVDGYPLLILQGKQRGRPFHACHIGTLYDTWVLTIAYYTPEQPTGEEDTEWNMVMESMRKMELNILNEAKKRKGIVDFMSHVTERLHGQTRPIALTQDEIKQLVGTLRGPERKGFENPDISPQVQVYWYDRRGVSTNAISFVRISKDGSWYTSLDYDSDGNLFGSGGGRMEDSAARMWMKSTSTNSN